jgi:hypothetical protein
LLKGPSPTFRKAFRDKIERDKSKTTASGVAAGAAPPNALEPGGALH